MNFNYEEEMAHRKSQWWYNHVILHGCQITTQHDWIGGRMTDKLQWWMTKENAEENLRKGRPDEQYNDKLQCMCNMNGNTGWTKSAHETL